MTYTHIIHLEGSRPRYVKIENETLVNLDDDYALPEHLDAIEISGEAAENVQHAYEQWIGEELDESMFVVELIVDDSVIVVDGVETVMSADQRSTIQSQPGYEPGADHQIHTIDGSTRLVKLVGGQWFDASLQEMTL